MISVSRCFTKDHLRHLCHKLLFVFVMWRKTFPSVFLVVLLLFSDCGIKDWIFPLLFYVYRTSSAKTDPASDPSALRPDASDASPASHASCAS